MRRKKYKVIQKKGKKKTLLSKVFQVRAKFNTSARLWEFLPSLSMAQNLLQHLSIPTIPSILPCVTLLLPCAVSSLQRSPNPAQLHPQSAPPSHLPINPNLNLYFLGLPNASAYLGVNPRPPPPLLPAQYAIPSTPAAGIPAAGDEKGFTLGFSGSSSHIRKTWAHGQNQLLQIRKDLRK